jgi:hypothetical protein
MIDDAAKSFGEIMSAQTAPGKNNVAPPLPETMAPIMLGCFPKRQVA